MNVLAPISRHPARSPHGKWHPAFRQVAAGVAAGALAGFGIGAAFSMRGQLLAILGANALAVSMVAGIAQWLGVVTHVGMRAWLNRTDRYQVSILAGIVLSLAPLPLLARATTWVVAAIWFATIAVGVGVWTPALDHLLSATERRLSVPFAMVLQRALAQTGFAWGALMMSGDLLSGGNLRQAFASQWVLLPIAVIPALVIATGSHDTHQLLPHPLIPWHGPPRSGLRLLGLVLVAMGLADYALLAFHGLINRPVSDALLPAFGGLGVMTAVGSSRLLRRVLPLAGRRTYGALALLIPLYAPCVFEGGPVGFAMGIVLWGFGLGALHALMAVALAEGHPTMPTIMRRSVAQLLLSTAWLIGSVLLGSAYLMGTLAITTLAIALQGAGGFCLIWSKRPIVKWERRT